MAADEEPTAPSHRDAAQSDDGDRDNRCGRSVLIKNLRFETSPAKVRRIFEEYGTVRDVYLPLDYYTKRPRGFGFVEFLDARDADAAVRGVNLTLVEGSEVTVVAAQDRRKSPDTMRAISTTGRRSDHRGGGRSASHEGGRYARSSRYERRTSPRYDDDDRDYHHHRGGGPDNRRGSGGRDDYRRGDDHRRTEQASRDLEGGRGTKSSSSRRRVDSVEMGRRRDRRGTRSRSRDGREYISYHRDRSPLPRDRFKGSDTDIRHRRPVSERRIPYEQ